MPRLLSGSTLRKGRSGEFINLSEAMPQLPPTPSTSTGFTIITDDKFRSTYSSSLGNVNFTLGEMYSNLPLQDIKLIATDSTRIIVKGDVQTTSTNSGALVIEGGLGVWGTIHTGEDIVVNGITMGRGYEGINNIVIRGDAEPQINENDNGQEAIVIGFDALKGLTTSYKSIAIGRYALSSGTSLSRSIAIGDSALKLVGMVPHIEAGSITNISQTNPVVVTVSGHSLTSGTSVRIDGVVGTTEVNNNDYYIWVQSTTSFALYTNINLTTGVDGTGYTAYGSSGTVYLNTVYDDNIGLGVNAGKGLINGRQNIFVGDDVAKNLTTGSYNIFIGHDVSNNMLEGTANISIGGDNLVNGLNNQINIGSVYYYDGTSSTRITSHLETGLGKTAVPTTYIDTIFTATQTNPVQITSYINGLSTGTRIYITNVAGMVELNQRIFYTAYIGTDTNNYHVAELYTDSDLTQAVDGSGFAAYTNSGTVFLLKPNGTVTVTGGVGIFGNLVVSDQVDVYAGMTVLNLITGTITTSTNLAGGALGSIPFQTNTGTTDFITIGANDTILYSDGTTATWQSLASITAGLATDSDNSFINTVTVGTVYYPVGADTIGDYTPLNADSNYTYVVTTATTSSYWVSGTNVLNVPGSVYAAEGNPLENYLLYTPRVTISATAPLYPRIGDFWIDSVNGVELQYVDDAGSRFWVQFTGL